MITIGSSVVVASDNIVLLIEVTSCVDELVVVGCTVTVVVVVGNSVVLVVV